MIELENKDLFGKTVADALARVELTVKDDKTKKRWINAISKAVVEIEQIGVFMNWQEESHSILIWSQKSNEIYTSNGVCQCRAFEQNSPCFHRADARLVRLYMEAVTAAIVTQALQEKMYPIGNKAKAVKETPYLKSTKQPVKVERYGSVRLPVYN